MKSLSFFFPAAFLCFVWAALLSCGKSHDSGSPVGAKPKGPIEVAFEAASKEYNIPVRFLLAVGFLESNLSPLNSSVPYFQTEGDTAKHNLGFASTETAFGLSRKALAVPAGKKGDVLETQVGQYAKWLSEKIKSLNGFNLKQNPNSQADRFEWLWAIGNIHIPDDRNIRGIWVKSLMNLLNEGRIWQNPNTDELIDLKPESSPFDENKLSVDSQALLRLTDDLSDINAARRLDVVSNSGSSLANTPQRIEVIHCPFSFATCLAMQVSENESEVRLGAHYLIPQDSSIVSRPLQILDHERRVQLNAADGTIHDVKDAVVIMLTGQSGRYVNGERMDANPTWYTSWQLRKLGSTIKGICQYLSSRDSSINIKECSSTKGDNAGVLFHHQGTRATYRWGEIVDYDPSIFGAYLTSSDANVKGDASLELPSASPTYEAGQDIKAVAKFSNGTSWIRLQRAVRCADKQIVWDTIKNERIINQKELQMGVKVWDAGPNDNGSHFMRVLVFDGKNSLIGWGVSRFLIVNQDKNFSPPAEACFTHE